MTDRSPYDPRDPRCKAPYGAVPKGTNVELTLRPRRAEGVFRCTLFVRYEAEEDRTVSLPMEWDGLDGEHDRFTVTLNAGDTPGLVWYSFRLDRFDDNPLELGPYQLTVYEDDWPVPPWFGEGVTYQIFPDRFCRSGIPTPEGLVGDRTVHTHWTEEPDYRPDEQGQIRNRDFFGGDLAGVIGKLDTLKKLGVETIYFNPIFEAAENHRYGTADYRCIDPMLGDEATFVRLCEEAHRRGMRIMLDGVFNHTGRISRYFNADGSYPELGAAQSQSSPYYTWYHFNRWPEEYDSWWGIRTLPAVNEADPGYQAFVYGDKDSVVRRWLELGADGWRLDVADELPDAFVKSIRTAVRETKPDAVVIGEVWEDGSNKIAYGVRRKHILGGHCDGLMNYPFRDAALNYLLGGDARVFAETMETLREHYPPRAYFSAMNALGTHDTPRVLTLLGVGSPCMDRSREWRADFRLSPEQRRRGKDRLKVGTALLFCFPGSPTIYYGDEAGMEGFEDPFNRRTYPWGREDPELLSWYTALGRLRRDCPALRRGTLHDLAGEGPLLTFARSLGEETILCACNAGEQEQTVYLPAAAELLLGDGELEKREEIPLLHLPPRCAGILRLLDAPKEPF